ncbi:SMP-30/gluconolactonase/LRE family protein [Nordella sp. HKS 07]|uniref:SMP-30/gluconolactonase/LRE family protein n=1 Tax=Nordella sp. HKS 07 TaxID=2712222 RepID=UPI0013E0ED32|nr:SMP-30/gluconolactonase/LRE family protein [Nordella sp. HKS 07]QIG46341.1 SMP-30/gluconolactonase/LRE family protein [Nordella sp. HKS 07]
MVDITCVVDAKAELGEGTLWDPKAGVLWWIDIWSKLIHRYDPRTGRDETFEAPHYLGCLGLREKGGLVLTMADGFHFFDPATGRFTAIADPENHMPETRFNDGKPDRQGRFWSGSMFEVPGRPIEFVGALYRMDHDLSIHRMIEGIGCSNGLAWSPDSRTMYFSDSHAGAVWAYDFDPATGDIENRRTFIDMTVTGGVADGATVDAEGCYWVTIPVTSKVCRYDPKGKLMQTVMLPTDLPTCCEFGGENLDILYVTSAVLRRPPGHFKGQKNPGGLFALDVGVKGLTLPAFRG